MRQLAITASITRRDEKSLQKYLQDIASHDILTPEQEYALFRQYHNGDEDAFNKIVQHNLRFVVSVAKQYQFTGLWLGDLISEGNIGLLKAARRFDETRGFKFISYAVWWIRQSILQALNERGRQIRVPANKLGVKSKISQAKERLLQIKLREAKIDELAEETGLTEKVIRNSERIHKKCNSLDAPLSDDSDSTLSQVMQDNKVPEPDFEVAIRDSQKKEVDQLLQKLPRREATVLSLYYGIRCEYPMSLRDISAHVGISTERIRQIKDRSINLLRRRYQHKMQPTLAN